MSLHTTVHWGDGGEINGRLLLADVHGIAVLDPYQSRALVLDCPAEIQSVSRDRLGITLGVHVANPHLLRRPEEVTLQQAVRRFYALNRVSIPEILAHLSDRMAARDGEAL